MSHLVPVVDYSGSPDPIAAIHAARLERLRRIAAAAYVPPPEPEPVKPTRLAVSVEDILAKYRLAVDTFGPVIDLTGFIHATRQRPAWPAAVAIVCRETGAKMREMASRRRYQRVAQHRQLAFWLMRNCTALSFPGIGRAAGGFDHSTIINACTRIEKRRVEDPKFRDDTARMRDELSGLLA